MRLPFLLAVSLDASQEQDARLRHGLLDDIAEGGELGLTAHAAADPIVQRRPLDTREGRGHLKWGAGGKRSLDALNDLGGEFARLRAARLVLRRLWQCGVIVCWH